MSTDCLLYLNANVTGTTHVRSVNNSPPLRFYPSSMLNGQPNLIYDGNVNYSLGYSFTGRSRTTYGPYFDYHGGGVLAAKWDEYKMSTCKKHPWSALKDLR